MSLDVYLKSKEEVEEECFHCESTYKERRVLFHQNITHNLNEMADKAGIYEALWRPHRLKEGYNIPENDHEAEWKFESETTTLAKDITPIIEKGLADMKARPEYYEQFNASNGWGLYKHFVPWIEKYLEACIEYPDAIVEVSR